MEERCICCDEIIPEGRQVCQNCEAEAEKETKPQSKNTKFK